MKSNKRRRTIEIKEGIVKSLRQASAERFDGKITPTEIASMIFSGRTDHIKNCDIKGYRSVSMTESMFFSIKCRADSIGQSIRSTANDVLMGQIPPLSKEELLEGGHIAEEMELHRMISSGSPMISSGSPTSSVRKLITVGPDDCGRAAGQAIGDQSADLSRAREESTLESSTKDQTFSKQADDEVLEKISEDIPHGGGIVYF